MFAFIVSFWKGYVPHRLCVSLTVFVAVFGMALAPAPPALAEGVTFQFGFDESDGTFTPSHRLAIDYAANLWTRWLKTSPTGSSIELAVDVEWDPNHSTAQAEPSISLDMLWGYNSSMGLWRTPAQEFQRTGNSGTVGTIAFGTNPKIAGTSVDWYTGTDGIRPDNHMDMVTIALHEIGHLLGMSTSYWGGFWFVNEGWGIPSPLFPHDLALMEFDTYLRDAQGRSPATGLFIDNDFILADPIVFVGPNAMAMNGGPVQIYLPGPNETPFNLAHPNQVGGLMTYGGRTASQHGLWAYEVGMFMDLGWQFNYPETMQSRILWGDQRANNVWHNGANWDWGLPPTSDVDVTLHMPDATSLYQLRVTAANSVARDVTIQGSSSNSAEALLQIYSGGVLTARDVSIGGGDADAWGRVRLSLNSTDDPGFLKARNLQVGSDGYGRLEVWEGSGVLCISALLGVSPGSKGTVTVAHEGSHWVIGAANTGPGLLDVGRLGRGEIYIEDGGRIDNGKSVIAAGVGSSGAVFVSGASTWASAGSLRVGNAGEGYLWIKFGGVVSNTDGYIGFENTADGKVEVLETGTWTNNGLLYVGYGGKGKLNIKDNEGGVSSQGAIVGAQSGSEGLVHVTGAGTVWNDSEWLAVGSQGSGELRVDTGASVYSRGAMGVESGSKGHWGYYDSWMVPSAVIGVESGSVGTASIIGVGSRWETEYGLWVGEAGEGALSIAEGAYVSSRSAFIGLDSGSQGTVTVAGEGSAWQFGMDWNIGRLDIGIAGDGTLNVENGGHVANMSSIVGVESGSQGVVHVRGENARWEHFNLQIGEYGRGELRIEQGGSVSTGGGVMVGVYEGSEGAVHVSGTGASWQTPVIYLGFEGTASLAIAAGGRVSNAFTYVGGNEGSRGAASVSGTGSQWNSESLTIGYGGGSVGEVIVEAGGAVSSDYTVIGDYADSSGSATVTGLGSIWQHRSFSVGYRGAGSLAVTNGGSVASEWGAIGVLDGSRGTVSILGTGSVWDTGTGLTVGDGGTGELTVADGGSLRSEWTTIGGADGSHGSITVSAGAAWVNGQRVVVGFSGNGELSVFSGATVTSDHGTIGQHSGSRGRVTVSGAGSVWQNADYVIVGEWGRAELDVAQGGRISSGRGIVGSGEGSHGYVTVQGSGSIWENDGWLTIAESGFGRLDVVAGGRVTSELAFIGGSASSWGAVNVSDAGSSWDATGLLRVGGYGGIGELRVAAGGRVSGTDAFIAPSSGSLGLVTIQGEGSTWTSSGDVFVGGWSGSAGGTGRMTVADGGAAVVLGESGLTVWSTGTLVGTGGTITGSVVSHGLVRLGALPGALAIDGSFTQSETGLLRIDMAGGNSTAANHLAITGPAALAGALEVLWDAPAYFLHGQTFDILTASSISGTFDSVALPTLPFYAGDAFALTYGENAVTLTALVENHVLGDFNGDGVLSGLDIPGFKTALADPAGWSASNPHRAHPNLLGDFNGDSVFSGLDIPGFKTALAGGAAAVPEPATVALLGLALAGALTRRRMAR